MVARELFFAVGLFLSIFLLKKLFRKTFVILNFYKPPDINRTHTQFPRKKQTGEVRKESQFSFVCEKSSFLKIR
jgi:hypothetical protein